MRLAGVLALVTWSGFALAADPPSSGGISPPSLTDPTTLTTQMIYREINGLEKDFTRQLAAFAKGLDRLDHSLTDFPTAVDQKLAQAKELQATLMEVQRVRSEERFSAVAQRFVDLDKRADLQAKAFSDALAEMKQTFGGSIAQQATIQDTNKNALSEKIAANKDAITVMGSHESGAKDNWTGILTAIGGLVGLIALYTFFNRRSQAPIVVEKA